jgi:hypothetical protein
MILQRTTRTRDRTAPHRVGSRVVRDVRARRCASTSPLEEIHLQDRYVECVRDVQVEQTRGVASTDDDDDDDDSMYIQYTYLRTYIYDVRWTNTRHDTTPVYTTLYYNTIQYNTIQYNTIQYTTRHDTVYVVVHIQDVSCTRMYGDV